MPATSPSTADWITAWSTAAAAFFTLLTVVIAVFALVAAVRAYRTQAGQLDLQRQQLADQQTINQKQSEVLELQADELRESIVDRRRVAAEQRRSQAARIFMALHNEPRAGEFPAFGEVRVVNTSSQPIYDVAICWFLQDAPFVGPSNDNLPTLNPLPRLIPDTQNGNPRQGPIHPPRQRRRRDHHNGRTRQRRDRRVTSTQISTVIVFYTTPVDVAPTHDTQRPTRPTKHPRRTPRAGGTQAADDTRTGSSHDQTRTGNQSALDRWTKP